MSDSENQKKTVYSSWFGKVSYHPDSGFSLSEKSLVSSSVELADELISVLSPSSLSNIRSISSLKPALLSEKPDYRALALAADQITEESGDTSEYASEYVSVLREIAIQTARKQLSASLTEDKKVIQAVEALDDLNETVNHLTERLVEWYGAYYPELNLPGDAYVRFVSEIPESASQSLMGAPATHEDLVLLQSFADDILSFYERKSAIEQFIENKMKETAPNLSQIAGVVLGARLLSMAGGLKHLAAMPSGSIQVAGAEKAMVKHLRSNAPSPKHGIIFSHPALNTAPMRLRGKIARAFSAAVSLAARTDYYSGTVKPEIEANLNEKIDKIKSQPLKKEEQ